MNYLLVSGNIFPFLQSNLLLLLCLQPPLPISERIAGSKSPELLLLEPGLSPWWVSLCMRTTSWLLFVLEYEYGLSQVFVTITFFLACSAAYCKFWSTLSVRNILFCLIFLSRVIALRHETYDQTIAFMLMWTVLLLVGVSISGTVIMRRVSYMSLWKEWVVACLTLAHLFFEWIADCCGIYVYVRCSSPRIWLLEGSSESSSLCPNKC